MITPTPPRRRDPDTVARALTEWFQHRLGYAGARVEHLKRPVGAGLSNETYFFDCLWNERRQPLVLQVGPSGVGLFRDYDLGVMAQVQRQLAHASAVPVAEVRWYERDASLLGAPFYVMNQVEGRVPSDNPSYHDGGWFAELPAADQIQAWRSGIEALTLLHDLDPVIDGFAFLVNAPWGMPLDADPAATRIAQWRDFLAWGSDTRLPLIEDALATLERTLPTPPGRVAVSWGDAKISNCVIADNRVAALLDWELCGLSDPEEDLAFWLLLDWAQWVGLNGRRLPHLPSPAATVDYYETLTARSTRNVPWWFRFGLVRMAIFYHRFLVRRRELGRLDRTADLANMNPMAALIPRLFALEGLP